ncbi:MAG: hypothetical protein ACJ762_01660 [Solirubrobacteraceae bacterium]
MTTPRSLLTITALAASTVAVAPCAVAAGVRAEVTGGHTTEAVDSGRPVALVAGALGVPAAVFREAFSHVTPASAGQEPDPEQVRKNKAALLEVLAPYGVTNERLDEVSNHYRYVESAGETWPHRAAVIRARMSGGEVVGFTIVRAGSGYTTAPTVTVPGHPTLKVRVRIAFSKRFARNGRVVQVAAA